MSKGPGGLDSPADGEANSDRLRRFLILLRRVLLIIIWYIERLYPDLKSARAPRQRGKP